jgi:ribosome-binding protein aMBF1 (putative translation factor)
MKECRICHKQIEKGIYIEELKQEFDVCDDCFNIKYLELKALIGGYR